MLNLYSYKYINYKYKNNGYANKYITNDELDILKNPTIAKKIQKN